MSVASDGSTDRIAHAEQGGSWHPKRRGGGCSIWLPMYLQAMLRHEDASQVRGSEGLAYCTRVSF